jgi:hypothetical protein
MKQLCWRLMVAVSANWLLRAVGEQWFGDSWNITAALLIGKTMVGMRALILSGVECPLGGPMWTQAVSKASASAGPAFRSLCGCV